MEEIISRIKSFIEKDRIKEAEELILEIDSKNIRNPYIHIELADICEEIGFIDRLIMELNLALRDSPHNSEVIKRLAEIYYDKGDLERAIKYWKEIIKNEPQDIEAYKELGALLEETNNYEEAKRTYEKGFDLTANKIFKELIISIERKEKRFKDETPVEEDSEIPTDSQLVRFLKLFSGREGVYARQWTSPTGESGYTPIYEPFNLSVAKNHILGNFTVGIYQLRMDNTVNFIAFDIDIPKYLLSKAIIDKNLWDNLMKNVHKVACRLVDIGASHDIPIYIEDSGFKGRHCWIFFDSPIPAKIAKRFGIIILNQLNGIPKEIHLEVFPKQTFVKEGGLGNLIKLPLGIHRKTGKRSQFINPDRKPFPDQLMFLEEIKSISKKDVFSFLERMNPLPEIEIEKEEKEEIEEKKVYIDKKPYIEEYDLERDKEFQYLLIKCEVIKYLADKINQYHELTNDERIVLIHSVGHLNNGPMAVNTLLKRCGNIDESLFLKNRLKGNPISCPKIRHRIPDITSKIECNCNFDPKLNVYPNPVLHIQTMDEIDSISIGQGIDSLQFQHLIQNYLKTKRQFNELKALLDKYQKSLDNFFEEAGIEYIDTSFGRLKRVLEKDGSINYVLEI
jgi:hypothetical protein